MRGCGKSCQKAVVVAPDGDAEPPKPMGFVEGMENAARRGQLNGEIVMVDREIAARKQELGVELYDLISDQHKARSIIHTPDALRKIEIKIKGPLESCSKDIKALQATITKNEDEAFKTDPKQVDNTRAIGQKISTTAKELVGLSKLYFEVKQAERQMKSRKEQFGLEIWDIITGVTNADADKPKKDGWKAVKSSIGKGVKGTAVYAVAKMDKDEKDVKACVKRAKEDVQLLEDKKQQKLNQITGLEKEWEKRGTNPLSSCCSWFVNDVELAVTECGDNDY